MFREVPGYHVFYELLRTIEPAQMAAVLTQWLRQQADPAAAFQLITRPLRL